MNEAREPVDPDRRHCSLKGDGESLFMEQQCLEINRGRGGNRQKSQWSMLQGPLQQKLVLYYSSDSGARK